MIAFSVFKFKKCLCWFCSASVQPQEGVTSQWRVNPPVLTGAQSLMTDMLWIMYVCQSHSSPAWTLQLLVPSVKRGQVVVLTKQTVQSFQRRKVQRGFINTSSHGGSRELLLPQRSACLKPSFDREKKNIWLCFRSATLLDIIRLQEKGSMSQLI